MLKKKKSKNRAFSLKNMPTVDLDLAKLKKVRSELFFHDLDLVGKAMIDAILHEDKEALIDIIEGVAMVHGVSSPMRAKKQRPKVKRHRKLPSRPKPLVSRRAKRGATKA